MLNEVLHASGKALNLSYVSPLPVDMGLTMKVLQGTLGLKRVILSLDSTFNAKDNLKKSTFPFNLYSADFTEDIMVFDKTAIELAARLILGKDFGVSRGEYYAYRSRIEGVRRERLTPRNVAEENALLWKRELTRLPPPLILVMIW